MPLTPGQSLTFYEILGPLGAGGMGEVYRARDTRLDREVAIKVLPAELADDGERLIRFEREAKTLASLNHPNVAGIHGIDQVEDTCFIAMELVPGEDLDVLLERGALPVPEAIDVCRQIAEGLEAAHEAGVVHRDLKPGNVRVTPDGIVKVLDFGLAKPLRRPQSSGSAGTASSTAQSDSFLVTEEGLVLGTPTYMSPEQARGKPVDRRTDVWAFGCVLFECLSGRRAFEGETFSDVIADVIGAEPDVSRLPAEVPARVRELVARCLEKDPRDRLRDIGEARVALQRADVEPAVVATRANGSGTSGGPLGWAIAAGLGALVTIATLAIGGGDPAARAMPEPPAVRTLTRSGDDASPSASPDGRFIAFRSGRDGRDRIWLKQLDTGGEQALTDGQDGLPRFAPDGSSILFLRTEGPRLSVYRQALVGGEARKIAADVIEACWSPDGSQIAILRAHSLDYGFESSLSTVDVRTREEREIYRTEDAIYALQWSLDGRVFSMATAPRLGQSVDQCALLLISTAGDVVERLPIDGPVIGSHVWIDGSRSLVYSQAWSSAGELGDSLSKIVRWDLEDDERRTLLNGEYLYTSFGFSTLNSGFGLTVVADESLAFDATSVRQLLWEFALEDGRAVEPGRNLLAGEARDRQPVYSPDGSRLRFASNRSGNLDLWELEIAGRKLRQLTDDRAQDWDPAFAADGEGLLWSSDRSGVFEIWSANADGSGGRQLSSDGIDAENPASAPGGEWIVYWSGNPDQQGLWRMRSDGSELERIVEGGFIHCEVSDDGRWAAFIFNEPQKLRSSVRVVEIETGKLSPFEIVIQDAALQSESVLLGRMRWVAPNALSPVPAIAFVGVDAQGRSGVFLQDFDPEADTSATRRPLAGFHDTLATESFDVAPDGSRITLAMVELRRKLMLAEGVRGLAVPR